MICPLATRNYGRQTFTIGEPVLLCPGFLSGQVISDRIPERTRLQAQEKQLQLSLERIRTASIQPPPKPRPVPAVAPLPPVNYLEQNAAIERAKLAISKRSASRAASAQEEISIKEQEIKELSQIPDLDPILIEHERAKLKQLQLNHQIAVNELELTSVRRVVFRVKTT